MAYSISHWGRATRGVLIALVALGFIISPAQASEENSISRLLESVRARNAERAFALLSPAAQAKMTGQAAAFLSHLRLKQPALYEHTAFRVLDTHTTPAGEIARIELINRAGEAHLAWIRLGADSNGVTKIESVAVMPDSEWGRDI